MSICFKQMKLVPFENSTSKAAFLCLQVRFGQIMENGTVETKQLGEHDGRVHKLAIEPGSPYIFYSCGEDGVVQRVCWKPYLFDFQFLMISSGAYFSVSLKQPFAV